MVETKQEKINRHILIFPETSIDNGMSNVYNNSVAALFNSLGKLDNSLLINPRIAFVRFLENELRGCSEAGVCDCVVSFNNSSTDIVELNLGSGSGIYRIGEVIHTGKQLHGAEATAEVLSFNSTANILKVTNSTGLFAANANVIGTFTGTSRKILDISPVDSEMVYLRVTPNPSTSNVNTDFGYTEELYESPKIP
jgi:hypothetical protein